MGRMVLIIAVGLVSVYGIVAMTFHRSGEQAAESSRTYAATTQARNLANTGVEFAIHRLQEESGWRDGFTDKPLHAGTFSVTVHDNQTAPQLEANQLLLSSVGYLQEDTATVDVLVEFGEGLPPIPAAMAVYSDSLNFDVSGTSFTINGDDTNPDGSPGTGNALPGLTVGGNNAYNNVLTNLNSNQEDRITGDGGTGSITQDNLDSEMLESYINDYVAAADTVISTSTLHSTTLGTETSPRITVLDGDIDISSVTGHGILVVQNGNSIRITGDFEYHGLIIMQGDNDFQADIYGNTHLYGAMLMGGSDDETAFDVDLRGNINVNYSKQVLTGLEMGLAPQLQSEFTVIRYYE